jgi:16S rRNA (adenine1518-N6/adenine1519-N6)-dimethyltransferase
MTRRGARLGQHFLTGLWAAAKLVDAARIEPSDTVLEIGPGHGALTKELLKTGARVVAIEKDEALTAELRHTFEQERAAGRFQLVEGDVRDFEPAHHGLSAGGFILAANIPYYITGEILRQFLSSDAQPKRLALLIQKEVADRILARNKKESILSLSVKAFGVPSIAAKVARGNFSPPPSVDSAILVVDDISKKNFEDVDESFFFSVVRAGFSSKRKRLAGNLANLMGKQQAMSALEYCGLPENVRAEDVPTDTWFTLVRQLAGHVQ